jgi:hypothetical protein
MALRLWGFALADFDDGGTYGSCPHDCAWFFTGFMI